MAEAINDRIRKFIIKNMTGKIGYSSETQSFQLVLRQTRSDDRDTFRKEIRKYAAWKNATLDNIDKFIEDAMLSIGLCMETRKAIASPLHLNTLKVGNIVSLYEHDNVRGDYTLRLLYVGMKTAGRYRFFVLSSNRTAIHSEDMLESYGTDVWSIDYAATFIVYRDGVRIPHRKDLVYQTYTLQHISLESPSIVQEVIDARSDFSYEEYIADVNSNSNPYGLSLSYRRPSMSLLLKDFSSKMPYYADFSDEGINGVYYNNSNAKMIGKLRMDNQSMLFKIVPHDNK